MSLIDMLRSISAAADRSAENAEAIRQIERGLLGCLSPSEPAAHPDDKPHRN